MHLDVWCDFPLSHLPRAMFAVPLMRKNAMAFDGTRTVSEKSLSTDYLSLKERVVYRRRVMLFTNDEKGVVLYPTWDLNGPDLSYFGDWQPSRTCPWVIDGRKLVADSKDRVLQMVEACKARGFKRLLVYEGVSQHLVLNRGWDLGSMPWLAFYAGVRKAAEVADLQVVAVTSANPYEGIKSAAQWVPHVVAQDGDVACYPCDVFSQFLFDPFLAPILETLLGSTRDLFSWLPVTSHTSVLHTQHRNAHWVP